MGLSIRVQHAQVGQLHVHLVASPSPVKPVIF